MIKYLITAAAIVTLSACTTPKTVLKNKETGQVAICGGNVTGSLIGGVIGYHIQKSNDKNCAVDYHKLGYEVIEQEEK
tara:strand:+ start:190 stop:423 length:234 start_codon:yes stop_codon:yes gene_type:complete